LFTDFLGVTVSGKEHCHDTDQHESAACDLPSCNHFGFTPIYFSTASVPNAVTDLDRHQVLGVFGPV
jgi:hypothetical protein